MKKSFYFICAFFVSFLIFSCSNLNNQKTASIVINFGNARAISTNNQYSKENVTSFTVELFYNEELFDTQTINIGEENTARFDELDEGFYVVKAKAFVEDKEIANGSSEIVEVQAGKTTDVSITLSMIPQNNPSDEPTVEEPTEDLPVVDEPEEEQTTGDVGISIEKKELIVLVNGKEVDYATLYRGQSLVDLTASGIFGRYDYFINEPSTRPNTSDLSDSMDFDDIPNDAFLAGINELVITVTTEDGAVYSKSIEVYVEK